MHKEAGWGAGLCSRTHDFNSSLNFVLIISYHIISAVSDILSSTTVHSWWSVLYVSLSTWKTASSPRSSEKNWQIPLCSFIPVVSTPAIFSPFSYFRLLVLYCSSSKATLCPLNMLYLLVVKKNVQKNVTWNYVPWDHSQTSTSRHFHSVITAQRVCVVLQVFVQLRLTVSGASVCKKQMSSVVWFNFIEPWKGFNCTHHPIDSSHMHER